MIPSLSTNDIIAAFLYLLPDWTAWNKISGTVQYQLISGLMQQYGRVTAVAENMVSDSFPATCVDLIPDWQESLGLPDPLIPATTQAQQQAQIVARLTQDGGASIPFFQSFIANLIGISASSVLITTFAPHVAQYSIFGPNVPLNPASFAWHWVISIPSANASSIPLVQGEVARIAPGYTNFTVTTH